jgi:hypothetical protein
MIANQVEGKKTKLGELKVSRFVEDSAEDPSFNAQLHEASSQGGSIKGKPNEVALSRALKDRTEENERLQMQLDDK